MLTNRFNGARLHFISSFLKRANVTLGDHHYGESILEIHPKVPYNSHKNKGHHLESTKPTYFIESIIQIQVKLTIIIAVFHFYRLFAFFLFTVFLEIIVLNICSSLVFT